jgi:hypothetical protein
MRSERWYRHHQAPIRQQAIGISAAPTPDNATFILPETKSSIPIPDIETPMSGIGAAMSGIPIPDNATCYVTVADYTYMVFQQLLHLTMSAASIF